MTDFDDNILKFCREEIDAAGILPVEPPGHPTRAIVGDLSDRKMGRVLLLGSAIALSIAAGIAVGVVATWITESPRLSVTGLPAHPAVKQEAPEDLQAQLRAWWLSRNVGPMARQPQPVHRGGK